MAKKFKLISKYDYQSTHEDILSTWLESDSHFVESRQAAYNEYLSFVQVTASDEHLMQKIVDQLAEAWSLTRGILAKHTVVAVSVLVFATLVLGTVSAEAFFDEEYKPSTLIQNLFSSNVQSETNPYSQLTPDNNNTVLNFDVCDLSIKYPRELAGKKIAAYRTQKYSTSDKKDNEDNLRQAQGEILIGQAVFDPTAPATVNDFLVQCFDANTTTSDDLMYKESFTTQKTTDNANYYATASAEKLRDRFGWFITEGEISDIEVFAEFNTSDGLPIENIFFKHGATLYRIISNPTIIEPNSSLFDTDPNSVFPENFIPSSGLHSNQVQLQFQSLITSKNDTEILEATEREIPIPGEGDTDTLPGYLTPATDAPREFGVRTGNTERLNGEVYYLGNAGGGGFYGFSNESFDASEYRRVRLYDEFYDIMNKENLKVKYIAEEGGTFYGYEQTQVRIWGEAFERELGIGTSEWELSSLDKYEIIYNSSDYTSPTTYEFNPPELTLANYVMPLRSSEFKNKSHHYTYASFGCGNYGQYGTDSDGLDYYYSIGDAGYLEMRVNSRNNPSITPAGKQQLNWIDTFIETKNDTSDNSTTIAYPYVFKTQCVNPEVSMVGSASQIIDVPGFQKVRTFARVTYAIPNVAPTLELVAHGRKDSNVYANFTASNTALADRTNHLIEACGGILGYYTSGDYSKFDRSCFEKKIAEDTQIQQELQRLRGEIPKVFGVK